MSGERPPRRWGGFRRWAAILLPFVLLARAVLLVFQLRSEREERAHAHDLPVWPPVPGEVLRFRSDNPGIEAWASDPANRPLLAAVSERDFTTQSPDTACLLNPASMAKGGGRLTLRSAGEGGTWGADWDGRRTMPTRDEIPEVETDAGTRAKEAAILQGADCGGTARLELSEWEVHALVNLLSNQPAPPGDRVPPRPGLKIHAILPDGMAPPP